MTRTSHSVSIGSACVEAGVGNQSMRSPRMTPVMLEMRTMSTIGRTAARSFWRCWMFPVSSSRAAIGPRSYAFARPDGNAVPLGGGEAALRHAGALRERTDDAVAAGAFERAGEHRAASARRAVLGGGDAVMAAERLRELRRLAVADAVGDLAYGEPACGQQ